MSKSIEQEAAEAYAAALCDNNFTAWERIVARKVIPLNLEILTMLFAQPLAEINQRLKALEQTRGDDLVVREELRAGLAHVAEIKDCGTWFGSQTYRKGNFCTHRGALWMCCRDSWNEAPGGDSGAWRMVAKGGRDGKDAPR